MATEENTTVTFRFPKRDIERLREIAQSQASTPNRLVVAAIRERLAGYKPDQAWCRPRPTAPEGAAAVVNERVSAAQRAEAVAVKCGVCDSPAGEPCKGPNLVDGVHPQRVPAAGVPGGPGSKHTPQSTATAARSFLDPPDKWILKPDVDALTLRNRRRPRRTYEVKRSDADSGVTVSIASRALDAIRQLVKDSPDVETGGQLFGHATPTQRRIVDIGGPGPLSKRTAMTLRHDADHEMALAAEIEDGEILELGHWHSHPAGSLLLSQPDLQRACGLASMLDRTNVWIELIAGPVEGFGNPPITAWALCPTRDKPWPFEVRKATVQ